MSWQALASRYPWPSERPDVPDLVHGWQTHLDHFERLLEGVPAPEFVEVGAWTGKTSRLLVERWPFLSLIAIDTWDGGADLRNYPDLVAIRDDGSTLLHDTYLRNLWPWRDRVIPVREDSVDGMQRVAEAGVEPDLVYIDACHTDPAPRQDIAAARSLFPEAILCGDDYCVFKKGAHAGKPNGVKVAVDELIADGLDVAIEGRFWWLR
jgi:hypothetical protein